MRGRGLLILLATLVVVLSGLSSLRRSPEKQAAAPQPAATTNSAAVAPSPPPGELSATMPNESRVKLKAGQTLKLQVRSDSPDTALISGLGLTFPVGPDLPGEIVIVAPTSGTYPVTLQISARTVGEIIVSG